MTPNPYSNAKLLRIRERESTMRLHLLAPTPSFDAPVFPFFLPCPSTLLAVNQGSPRRLACNPHAGQTCLGLGPSLHGREAEW